MWPHIFIILFWHSREGERPPSSPPNLEVIRAGGHPAGFTPILQKPKWGEFTNHRSKFLCGQPGARNEGSKIRTLFTGCIILQKNTGLDLKSGGHERDEWEAPLLLCQLSITAKPGYVGLREQSSSIYKKGESELPGDKTHKIKMKE